MSSMQVHFRAMRIKLTEDTTFRGVFRTPSNIQDGALFRTVSD